MYASARAAWSAGQEKLPQGRAGLLPQLNLSASTQYNERDIGFRNPASAATAGQYNSNGVMLSLTQPLFRAQNYTQYEEAKTLVAQADMQLALVSSQSSLASTRLGLGVGVRTQVDVLNAQQQLFTTRRDLAQATYNYTLSLLKLKAATGRLSEDDLLQVNAWQSREANRVATADSMHRAETFFRKHLLR